MQKSSRTYRFTILELMVCFVLISIVASFIGWKIKESLDLSYFQSSTAELKQEIEKLQILALTYGSDMRLELRADKQNKWSAFSKVDEAALRSLNGKRMGLKGIEEINQDGKDVKRLDFTIFSNGRILPESVIEIRHKEYHRWIDLRAPLLIKFSSEKPPPLRQSIPKKPEKKNEIIKPGI